VSESGIAVALAKVMAELPAIGKERHQTEGQGVQYAYRGIEQVTREVQTLFAKHGVVVVPAVQSIAVKDITVNSKPWTDTTLIVNYTLVGPDGSKLGATTVGIGRDNSDKGANKAMTQAFKYLLLQVLCIADKKDDADGTTIEADNRQEHPNAKRVADAIAEMKSLPPDNKTAMKEWAHGKPLNGQALIADPAWLELVEEWLEQEKAGLHS
jgi:hypothetical protein